MFFFSLSLSCSRQCCSRDVGVLQFTSVSSASRLSGNQLRVSVTLHSSTSSHTTVRLCSLFSVSVFRTPPRCLLCSECGPCCFKTSILDSLVTDGAARLHRVSQAGSKNGLLLVNHISALCKERIQSFFYRSFLQPGALILHYGSFTNIFKAHCRLGGWG